LLNVKLVVHHVTRKLGQILRATSWYLVAERLSSSSSAKAEFFRQKIIMDDGDKEPLMRAWLKVQEVDCVRME
jgi:hypothetical protein